MKGNTGKYIKADLSGGDIAASEFPEAYYRNYVGGSGLAAKYFWENGDFAAAPLSEAAHLIFMNGPFAGLRLSGASRNCVAGRSPLTGGWSESSCGGYFAPELRYAGFDGIVITGKCEAPTLLLIEDQRIRLVPAVDLWGQETDKANQELKKRYGKKARTLIIGPAGEARVNYAIILQDGHHAFGRAGFGAVMGSKNLKAIVVRASKKEMDLFDPAGYEALRKPLNEKIRHHLISSVLREDGTAASLESSMHSGDVPIKNWTSNYQEGMGPALNGSTLTEKYLTNRGACRYCAVACKRVVEVKEGPFALPKGPGPEYETIAAFGSLIGSMDLAAACKAGRVCNDLGMDTISAGSTIAWAMEAYEKGILTEEDTGGIRLSWGDMRTVIDFILPRIASQDTPLGKLLGRGSVAVAKKIGKGALDFTTHSKGMEAPMHDPRGGGHGMALTYAISPRGACHVAFPMLFMETGACYYPEINFEYDLTPMTDRDKPEAAMIGVDIGSLENSACLCQFADRSISIPEWLELFNTVAGYQWNTADMMTAGRRVFFIKRLINHRFGLRARDDTLSRRMLEPARDGEPKGIKMNFEGMKDKFYRMMGLDTTSGIPSREILEAHNMQAESQRIYGG